MMERIVRFSIKRPKLVIWAVVVLSLLFGSQLPRAKTDTDPKHMLPATSPVRVYNDKVEERFELHADWVALGVADEAGVLNRTTPEKIARRPAEVSRIPGVITKVAVSCTSPVTVQANGQDLYA